MSAAIDRYRRIVQQHNKRTVYATPRDFLDACVTYFEWATEFPLQEEKLFHYQGDVISRDTNKARAFTKSAMCHHIGIPTGRLDSYRKRGGAWLDAVELVEEMIHVQKFEAAAAGLMNASVIMRDLGLAENSSVKADVTTEGKALPAPPAIQIVEVPTGYFHPTDEMEEFYMKAFEEAESEQDDAQ